MNAPKKRKVSKFTGLKVLLATLSVAGILGFWNLFSVKALQDENAANLQAVAPADPPPGFELGLPPLPTLVAVESAPTLVVQSNTADAAAAAQVASNEALPLRQVSAPTPVVVQQQRPVVVEMGGAVATTGGGGGGGGGHKGAATTHSS